MARSRTSTCPPSAQTRGVIGLMVASATALSAFGAAPAALAAPEAAPTAAASASTLRADVDGDGKLDTISVAHLGAEKYRLTVRTATGKTVNAPYALDFMLRPTEKPLYAAVGMDGRPGAEIILRAGSGPHTWWYKVMTWRKGRLAIVNSPDTRTPDWFNDGQAAGWTFYTIRGVRFADRYLLGSPRPAGGGGYFGTRTTFRWGADSWQRVDSKAVSVGRDIKTLDLAIGWRGLGLSAAGV